MMFAITASTIIRIISIWITNARNCGKLSILLLPFCLGKSAITAFGKLGASAGEAVLSRNISGGSPDRRSELRRCLPRLDRLLPLIGFLITPRQVVPGKEGRL